MEIFGDFELYRDKRIGKGGGGEVYKGRQISLNRPVAIKFLNKELTSDESFVHRFHREAECLAKLNDEHIIQVYGAGEYQGSHYFAMEYVPGVSLDKFVQRKYKFPFDDVIYIGIAVAKALKTVWESEAQIIHRDIKPANIMISFPPAVLEAERLDMKEARIKVMDFGLARTINPVGEGKTLTMTVAGMIVGTPKYMPPEQGLGKPVDIRSDIYSLGIVLYEISTGQAPFENDSLMGLIYEHIYTPPPTPRSINHQIPPELESIIIKCIQKDPTNRYRNPIELLDDLEAIKQKPTSRYIKSSQTVKEVRPSLRRSNRFIRKVLLLVLITVLCYLLYSLTLRHPAAQSYLKPNTEPASICLPSSGSILGNDEMKVISHMPKDINNLFDYGLKIQVFIQNLTDKIQTRELKIELDWGGKTYFKKRQITLGPKNSNNFMVDFYEPTAGVEYYTYRVLLTSLQY